MKLIVIVRSVYGVDKIYPACSKSTAFLNALGLKTFTESAKHAARALGYSLVIEQKQIEL